VTLMDILDHYLPFVTQLLDGRPSQFGARFVLAHCGALVDSIMAPMHVTAASFPTTQRPRSSAKDPPIDEDDQDIPQDIMTGNHSYCPAGCPGRSRPAACP
jgi:hypothetical protein